jgi:hypothetical protein
LKGHCSEAVQSENQDRPIGSPEIGNPTVAPIEQQRDSLRSSKSSRWNIRLQKELRNPRDLAPCRRGQLFDQSSCDELSNLSVDTAGPNRKHNLCHVGEQFVEVGLELERSEREHVQDERRDR